MQCLSQCSSDIFYLDRYRTLLLVCVRACHQEYCRIHTKILLRIQREFLPRQIIASIAAPSNETRQLRPPTSRPQRVCLQRKSILFAKIGGYYATYEFHDLIHIILLFVGLLFSVYVSFHCHLELVFQFGVLFSYRYIQSYARTSVIT